MRLRKNLINKIFILIFVLVLSTKPTIAENQDVAVSQQLPHFVLSDENIRSWQEVEQGFVIKLNEHAAQQFSDLTSKNVNKRLELYVGNLLVSSPVIRDRINGSSLMLSVAGEMKEDVLSLLPPDLMSVDENNEIN